MNEPAKHPVKATQTTIRIVEALKELNGAGVTELATHLGLPKSSVHNYLSTLREEEFVVQDGDRYHVGLRFLGFGSFARYRSPIYEVGKPEIDGLAEETGELANLLVEEHGRGVYIYRQTGERAVNVDARIGHRVYLHNTALGKAILSQLPRSRVEAILERHGMPAETAQTVTDRDTLFEELAEIRERGVAFDDGERLSGLRCVAVPVVTDDGAVAGAISVAGPTSRMRGDRYESELPERLRDVANILQLNLTYA